MAVRLNCVDDADGFDAFVSARLSALLRYGRALTGDEDRAADLVQDALERVLGRWAAVVDHEAYVRRVMLTRNISMWRRVRREWPMAEMPEDAYTTPEPNAELFMALRSLPPRQRAVIALRYLDDLTEAETARILGCSVGTVKSQHSDGIKKLRSLLAPVTEDVS